MNYKHYLLFLFTIVIFSACSSDDSENPQQTANDAIASILTITGITENSAIINAEIVSSSETVTERGVVWSTNSNPTTDDNKVSSGSGLGEFQATLNGLETETTYFVRSYAITNTGVGYSQQDSFLTLNQCDTEIFVGDVTLRSQGEVDNFGINGYCAITGFLILEDENSNDPIIDLSALSTIKTIEGGIGIVKCNFLENLEGLNSLQSCPGGISIRENDMLQNIEALSSVSGEAGAIQILNCDALVNLSGLEGISSLNLPENDFSISSILIANNKNLESIQSLSNVNIAPRGIGISNNPNLQSLAGLQNISLINIGLAKVVIFQNDQLQSLVGLEGLNTIIGTLEILNNNSLSSLNGLNNLEFINESLQISLNPMIQDLDVFENLNQLNGPISISSNSILSDFCGLNNLILTGTFTGTFNTDLNLYNPTLDDMLNGDCSQ